MKRTNALLLALVMVLSILLGACGEPEGEVGGNAAYSVKVTDAQGVPYTAGVIVKFMKDGAQVAMQSVDANGVATKELEKGNYTVELVFTSENASYYDSAAAVLSANKTSTELQLMNKVDDETTMLYVGDNEYAAYYVGENHAGDKWYVKNIGYATLEEAEAAAAANAEATGKTAKVNQIG